MVTLFFLSVPPYWCTYMTVTFSVRSSSVLPLLLLLLLLLLPLLLSCGPCSCCLYIIVFVSPTYITLFWDIVVCDITMYTFSIKFFSHAFEGFSLLLTCHLVCLWLMCVSECVCMCAYVLVCVCRGISAASLFGIFLQSLSLGSRCLQRAVCFPSSGNGLLTPIITCFSLIISVLFAFL